MIEKYPKWVFHATEDARIVRDEAEHAALGAEWAETPAAFEAAEAPEPPRKKGGRK